MFKVHVKYEAKQTETESSVIFLADFMQQKISLHPHALQITCIVHYCISQNECDELAFAYNFA